MSKTKIELQREALDDILRSIEGVKKIYNQPPSEHLLEYPCLIYTFSNYETLYSDDKRYLTWPSYMLTLIDKNPESAIQQSIMDLGGPCFVRFNRFFTSDNLNHWVYEVTFTQDTW